MIFMNAKLRIRELMADRQWSEYRLALESGLSQSTISNIFSRNTTPSIPTLESICKGFGITLAQFFAEGDWVELTPEQHKMFLAWSSLSSTQKKAISQLFYPQLGVKLCSMAGGGVQKIYMVFLREPSRRDRSGSDLFHLRDGFEIKMNFDRNVSCFIFVNALMHDDFFD